MVHCQFHWALGPGVAPPILACRWLVDQGTLSALLIPFGATIKMARNSNLIWGQLLKWWVSPTTMGFHGFPTKNDQHLGCEMGWKPTIYGKKNILCRVRVTKMKMKPQKLGLPLKGKNCFTAMMFQGRVVGVERKLQNWWSRCLLFKQENRRRWEQIGNKHVERKFIGSWRPGLKLKRNTHAT